MRSGAGSTVAETAGALRRRVREVDPRRASGPPASRRTAAEPVLPDYAGALRLQRRARAARAGADAAPAWFPSRARPTPTRSCCSCSTGSAGTSSQERRRLAPDAGGDGRRSDHHRRAVHDDGHRPHLDHHRPHAGRARRDRLPRWPSTARCSTCCAGRPPVGDARPAHPAATVPAARRRSSATGRRRDPGRVRAPPASRGAHLDGVRFTATACRRRCVVEVRRLLRAGEPFVYAYYDGIDKVAHEYGLGEHYDAELAAVDRLVGDLLDVAARPAPCCVVTADHGQVDVATTSITLDAGRARPRVVPVGRGPVPLAARPARAGADAAGDAAEAHHGDDGLGASPRADRSTRAGSGPGVTDAAPPPARRRGPRGPRRRSRSTDPADTGPFELIGRHGSLTSAEMLRAAARRLAARREPERMSDTRVTARSGRRPSWVPIGIARRASQREQRAARGRCRWRDDRAAARRGRAAVIDDPSRERPWRRICEQLAR